MYPANDHRIRRATDADAPRLRLIARLDSQRPLGGQILVGEIGGMPAAALSLLDGRVIADPFQHTARLTQCLRMRAAAHRSLARRPSLRDRMRAGVRVTGRRPAESSN